MTGAFTFADPGVAAEVNTVAELAQARLTRVRHEGEPTAGVRAVARITDRARLSHQVARVTRRAADVAARLLLR